VEESIAYNCHSWQYNHAPTKSNQLLSGEAHPASSSGVVAPAACVRVSSMRKTGGSRASGTCRLLTALTAQLFCLSDMSNMAKLQARLCVTNSAILLHAHLCIDAAHHAVVGGVLHHLVPDPHCVIGHR
jgi:hypothetical protein